VSELGSAQLKHEVDWEPIHIPTDGKVEALGLNRVQGCEIAIQHHSLTADDQDAVRNDRGADATCLPASHGRT
jgi:hypothetical protein